MVSTKPVAQFSNKSTHHDDIDEVSSWVGGQIPSTEYEVIIEGEQKFEISGYH